ncbi:uncharacterized protein N7483_009618 [Penicillium malachiteum]|uniref:uncharacterized protein n=1 Tax=Penicillium malachiteum TaxID=1324776 RepID=UPI002547E759|nr:uncharacterized protein N7483_009618 [Penicillium malachiteum]KAJ5721684.1 hypothetical protein N7483_009618 [Penicillium malachiteum]
MAEISQVLSEQEPEPELNPTESNIFKTAHLWPSDEVTQHTPRPITSAFTDKDESAVAGLLALGTSTDEIIEPNLTLSDFAISPPTREPMAPLELPDVTAYSSLDQILNPPHAKHDLSSTETLELLRHYRYNIAPWDHRSDAQLDLGAIAFLRALGAAKNCVVDVSSAWTRDRLTNGELFEALSPHALNREFNSAVYWLLVRLDLAAALATDTNLQIPLPPSPPYMTDADFGSDPFGSVFCYAHRPLWLCGRAIQFTHDESSPQVPPLHTWMQLVEELESWYQERPQGFQPMLELEAEHRGGLGQSFPVVLFANGAGVFSSQLYHTAMLILLHNRPRTARTSEFRSARMSPLWHAQRICSIALNNERRECWDPCLLASFLTAARRMTHEVQQQEILLGFNRIRTITGWDVGNLLHDLQEEWGVLET